MTDDQGKTTPEGDPKPVDDNPEDPKGIQGPTDEELRAMYASGDLLTKERNEEIVRQRLEREREQAKLEAEEERRKTEEKAKRDALKDQEQYKELSDTQAAEIAEKDTAIEDLKVIADRVGNLEKRLETVVKSRLEGLAKPYQDLLAKMSVEERADWLDTNAELLETTGKPGGSPASPTAIAGGSRAAQHKEDQAAAEHQRRAAGMAV